MLYMYNKPYDGTCLASPNVSFQRVATSARADVLKVERAVRRSRPLKGPPMVAKRHQAWQIQAHL